MANIVHNALIARHIAAERSEGLAEGAHYDINLIGQTEIICRASAAVSDNAETVSIVNHNARFVFLRKLNNFGQLAYIAAHAEHAVCHNKLARFKRNTLKRSLKVCHIAVVEANRLCVAQFAAVINACMIFFIAKNVIASTRNRADDAQIALETR